ncbi:imelysin family protein [Amorphus orientalis]|uniref:Lipoprotein n=1 Tax=Amorphus orientalis TaxID=649198 RepID=A0AAE3VJV3_9HYPH|nr:imelysin family protein [Amorphus orientalis]MDQ0313689.1 putative lipoprotein [Amorphus orientalis]
MTVFWIRTAAAAALVGAFGTAALAQPAEPIPFRPTVSGIIGHVVVPAYDDLVRAADAEHEAVAALCEAPNEEALATARDRFADLVRAFSSVEPYRFGPAREENRFERLFFWPDRRGIGLRQVQGLLAEEDPSALEVESLQDKSVAVQGLIALDYVLSDDDAVVLAETPAGYRCRYAEAIAGAILATATDIRDGWTGEGGYGELMLSAGPDNPIYRSHGEALQEFLEAAREQLQIVSDMKIRAIVGEEPDDARPKLSPFWRSGLVLSSMDANLAAILTLQNDSGLAELLPDDAAFNAGSLAFQIGEARRVLSELAADGTPWIELAEEPEAHGQLLYATIPIDGALEILAERYPAALGLILGFNSLDGD